MSVRYLYECHLSFKEISSGVYCVVKDKLSMYHRGVFKQSIYVTSDEVVKRLNNTDIKVSLYDKRDVHLTSNFKLSDDNETT